MKWICCELSKVAYIGDGAHASLQREKTGIPYLTSKNITTQGIDYSNLEYISEETYKKHFKKDSNALTQPQKNDILYSIIGSLGGVYVVKDEKVGISSSVAIIRAFPDRIVPQFLAYYLKSPFFYAQIQAIKGGSAQGFISLKKIGSIEIRYPEEIALQNKIASILNNYDLLIENNKKQILLLEEAAQRLYEEWFIKLKFPGYENCNFTNGKPDNWKKEKISKYVDIKPGYAFKSSWWKKSGNPVVKIKDIFDNLVDTTNLDYVDEEHTKNLSSVKLAKGDVVIAMTGATIGKIGLVPNINNLYTNQRVAKLSAKKEFPNLTPFIFCFFGHDSVLKQIDSISSASSAQQNISDKQLGNFEVISNLEMVNKFCECTYPFFEKIFVLVEKNQFLMQARDLLLRKLVSH